MRLPIRCPSPAFSVCLAALLLAACGSSSSSSSTPSGGASNGSSTASNAAQIKSSYGDCKVTGAEGKIRLNTVDQGTLTIGALIPLPGFFNGVSPQSIHSGFEYCLAAEIAWRAGLKLGIQSISFDKVVAGSFPNVDAVISAVSITPPREKVLDFSKPYNHVSSGILVRSAKPLTQDTVKRAKIGLLVGSVQTGLVSELGAKPVFFQSPVDLSAALASGQIDAGTGDIYSMLEQAKASHGEFKVAGQYTGVGGVDGIAFKKGSPSVAPVNEILANIGAQRITALKAEYLNPMLAEPVSEVPVWSP